MTRRGFLVSTVAVAAAQPRAVQTVIGPVSPSALGLTLMHEHVVTDLRDIADRRPEDYDREDAIAVSLPPWQNFVRPGRRRWWSPRRCTLGGI
ncbi:MAG: hypothetical protein R2724_26590 [Bryobacterales bacterium]